MKKKNSSLKERLKKAKNPLNGVKTRDLIITLAVLLICFFSGFFGGYACNKSCKRVEASADTKVVRNFVTFMNIENRPTYVQFPVQSSVSNASVFFPFALSFPVNDSISFANYGLGNYTYSDFGWFQQLPSYNDNEFTFDYHYFVRDEMVWQFTSIDAYLSYTPTLQGQFKYLVVMPDGLVFRYDIGYVSYKFGYSDDWEYNVDNDIGIIYSYSDLFGENLGYAEGYDEGYKEGNRIGYDKGKLDGLSEGDDIGYERGKAEGEDIGYQRGLDEQLENITPWQHIVNGVNGFLGIELFPGVSFSLLISLAFGLILLGIVWKTFLGG